MMKSSRFAATSRGCALSCYASRLRLDDTELPQLAASGFYCRALGGTASYQPSQNTMRNLLAAAVVDGEESDGGRFGSHARLALNDAWHDLRLL